MIGAEIVSGTVTGAFGPTLVCADLTGPAVRSTSHSKGSNQSGSGYQVEMAFPERLRVICNRV